MFNKVQCAHVVSCILDEREQGMVTDDRSNVEVRKREKGNR